jgi:alpha-1,6-mannosyltransferase
VRIVRIANFVTPSSGGLRTALRSLGAGFLASGHEPVLIIPGPQASVADTPQGKVITLYGPRVPFMGGYRVLLARRRVRAMLASLKPDVLEVSDRTTLRWTGRWARAHGVPSVMVSHESARALLPSWCGFAADWLNRRTASAYDRVLCTTDWAAAEFNRIGAVNVVQAPLGVDLSTFAPGSREPGSCEPGSCEPGGFEPGDEVLLVHCGRLSAEKKPHRSLRTLASLRSAGVAARLVVAGDGPLRQSLERYAAQAGLPVTFTGFIGSPSALAALFSQADVVLAPGPAETFGLAAVEALACGTPVVVSASSALPAIVGDAGVAVAGDDLASGVLDLLRRPVRERRAAARARAEMFGWPVSVRAFLDVYGGLT